MKSGFVSIVGRPNVGKSTLLNCILARKIAITSNVAGTTRNIIEGIYHMPDCQIIFVDTPGISKPLNKLGKVLNKQAYALTKDVDAIMLVVDIASGIGKGDHFLMESLQNSKIPIIAAPFSVAKITEYSASSIIPINFDF